MDECVSLCNAAACWPATNVSNVDDTLSGAGSRSTRSQPVPSSVDQIAGIVRSLVAHRPFGLRPGRPGGGKNQVSQKLLFQCWLLLPLQRSRSLVKPRRPAVPEDPAAAPPIRRCTIARELTPQERSGGLAVDSRPARWAPQQTVKQLAHRYPHPASSALTHAQFCCLQDEAGLLSGELQPAVRTTVD
ncbi:hypothetical protein BDV95DRAFT_69307 [Massariosphaeria phaeospora]|uniref:Uncharacterized protein n=1 Tax=Massariosphaeria phaeospora TaxID=100035 RepID=A0A7C8MN21_9PLEO|nr:hypothetical protein BDV95DRAFT_69307 [Massariosphaeria phaeospora]